VEKMRENCWDFSF